MLLARQVGVALPIRSLGGQPEPLASGLAQLSRLRSSQIVAPISISEW